MRSVSTVLGLFALLSAVSSPACFGADASPRPALARDPFHQPRPPAAKKHSAAEQADERPQQEAWRPQLRAIIHDNRNPLVNIDGQIFGLGDTMEGYQLQKVEERAAVLVKDGRQIRLHVDGVLAR